MYKIVVILARYFACLVFVAITFSVKAADVKDIRVAHQDGTIRLVFELTAAVDHRLFPLDNPDRIVLDVLNTGFPEKLHAQLSTIPVAVLQRVRFADRNGSARFVLDLSQKVRSKSSFLPATDDYGPRILVELEYAKPAIAAPVRSVTTIANEKRDVVVVIDAGHGGKDPGALGQYNVREKDIVLSIAKELAARLNRIDGIKAVLTRSTDVYLKLRERSQIAREANADLLISVHADAFTNPRANGASVWALSLSGKTNEMGRWLAEQEQSSELVGGISLDDKDQLLAEVLLDMSMNSTIQYSLDIGKSVLDQMGKVAKLHKQDVQQAGFMVLRSPDIPSILIETGFVSNPTEAKNLASLTYRRKIAASVAVGVEAFFKENPPEGTLLAWRQLQSRQREYVVARGDTLSEIARKNQVSLAELRRVNALQNDVIRIGQKLIIPAG